MLDVTPTGPMSAAVHALRALIANVPWFQTWTGTSSAIDAIASVFSAQVGYPVHSVTIAAGVASIGLLEPHAARVGDIVTISGASLGEQSQLVIDGPQTVTAVTPTTLSFATDLPDVDEKPDQAFVMPTIRPIIVVADADDGLHSESIGTGGTSIVGGTLEILLEADVSEPYRNSAVNAQYESRNAFGSFVQGLMATQGTGDFMELNRIQTISGPEFTSDNEQDSNAGRFERWRALLSVTWGVEP